MKQQLKPTNKKS